MERSGNDVVDVNARRVTAMNSLMNQLGRRAHLDHADSQGGTLGLQDMDSRKSLVSNVLLSLCVENLSNHDLRFFRCTSKACSQMEDFDNSSVSGRILKEMNLKSFWDDGVTVEHSYIAGIGRKMENQFEPW